MKLRPLIRTGLGIATLVAASSAWIAVGDQHWAAALVLGALALGCAYPALSGRDLFDPRQRRRKHRRHRSKQHAATIITPVETAPTPNPASWPDDNPRA